MGALQIAADKEKERRVFIGQADNLSPIVCVAVHPHDEICKRKKLGEEAARSGLYKFEQVSQNRGDSKYCCSFILLSGK